jgi:HEAT repeat protein
LKHLEDLLAALGSGDDTRAEAALEGIQTLGETVIPLLLELAHSADPDARWWAVRALSAVPQVRAEDLLPSLGDNSSEVRAAAALALCNHPAEVAVPALIRTLSDEDSVTAGLAANALTRIGAAAVEPLLENLGSQSPVVRILALRALAEIGDHRGIPAMLQAAQEGSAVAQHWAREGLERLGLNMVFMKP